MPSTKAGRLAHAILPYPTFIFAQRVWRALPKSLRDIARLILPHSSLGDCIYHQIVFVQTHRRKPDRRSMLLNDLLFRMICGHETDLPLRRLVTDKEFVKDYVRKKVGDQFNIPTIAVLRSFAEAASYSYPRRCVIKSTHASGHVFLRQSGEPVDLRVVRDWFDCDYYKTSRIRYYRGLQPKVIVEPFIFDCDAPHDYKIFCWRGEPRLVLVVPGRISGVQHAYYDVSWKRQPFTVNYPSYDGDIPRPPALELMLDIAGKLSADFTFMRVDLYAKGERVAVGELTGIPLGGQGRFMPAEGEELASRLLFGDDFS